MLLDAWAIPTLIIAVPQKIHFITIFLSFHPISHWSLSPSTQPFQTQSLPSCQHNTGAMDGITSIRINTVLLILRGPQQTKKAVIHCCGQGSAASCQRPGSAPLHSLLCQDPATQTERLSHVFGILIPHQKLTRIPSCQGRHTCWPSTWITFCNSLACLES